MFYCTKICFYKNENKNKNEKFTKIRKKGRIEETQICRSLHIKSQCFLQVNLVDWLKMMVGSRRSEEVVDPNIETRPSTRALKRTLLTALRCVDPDSEKRPKMGQVVRMLESEEYPIPREVSSSHCYLFL